MANIIGNAQPAPPVVCQPGFVQVQPVQANPMHVMPQPQRAHDVLLAVVGVGSKDHVTDLEGMTEAEFVAANKKNGSSFFRCRKNGHF
jgi:hypothetical protein